MIQCCPSIFFTVPGVAVSCVGAASAAGGVAKKKADKITCDRTAAGESRVSAGVGWGKERGAR